MPSDEGWLEACRDAEVALENARGKLSFSEKDKAHRRGRYPAFAVGLSHGGGQKVCFSFCGFFWFGFRTYFCAIIEARHFKEQQLKRRSS